MHKQTWNGKYSLQDDNFINNIVENDMYFLYEVGKTVTMNGLTL